MVEFNLSQYQILIHISAEIPAYNGISASKIHAPLDMAFLSPFDMFPSERYTACIALLPEKFVKCVLLDASMTDWTVAPSGSLDYANFSSLGLLISTSTTVNDGWKDVVSL